MHLRSRLLCTTLLVLAFFVLPSVVVAQPPAASTARETLAPTALDRYVYAPDPHFAYRLVDTRETTEWTAYIIELTSQAWRTPEEVDRPVWKHWLTIIMPREVAHNSALLYISGGRNGADPPKAPDPMVVQIARQTRSVAA
ncbi:MAG TPA: PhoPQ-activated protein PqaA family protein, partial [Candidatus Hydrogenedentes bacterium]|nr:PhoPQ-activated protein PqaA family protein [Candidatus Hydrogenedentota bacterium]